MASGGFDGTVPLWDAATGAHLVIPVLEPATAVAIMETSTAQRALNDLDLEDPIE